MPCFSFNSAIRFCVLVLGLLGVTSCQQKPIQEDPIVIDYGNQYSPNLIPIPGGAGNSGGAGAYRFRLVNNWAFSSSAERVMFSLNRTPIWPQGVGFGSLGDTVLNLNNQLLRFAATGGGLSGELAKNHTFAPDSNQVVAWIGGSGFAPQLWAHNLRLVPSPDSLQLIVIQGVSDIESAQLQVIPPGGRPDAWQNIGSPLSLGQLHIVSIPNDWRSGEFSLRAVEIRLGIVFRVIGRWDHNAGDLPDNSLFRLIGLSGAPLDGNLTLWHTDFIF
jgi:hypothetical protein